MSEAPAKLPHEAPWVVLKFGGTSVASLERWQMIAEVARARIDEGMRPLLVCSAVAGLSNLLERLLAHAENGEDIEAELSEVSRKHHQLAHAMDLDADSIVGDLLEELDRLARGAHMLEEASPRIRARVMSMGELMSTRLGAAWLKAQGIRAAWQDARDVLFAQSDPHQVKTAPDRHYLQAACSHEQEPKMSDLLGSMNADVVVTQGFIASDHAGDTVLLGRGGSDTSAAYFAARIGARRLEIWTDVPGLFTTNPRAVPSARLLRRLRYREAEELALMGAKVLHPRCIAPVAAHHIPLHIKCTQAPEVIGTIISSGAPTVESLVKAVSLRKGMILLSVEPDRALQNVGFLAEASACFAKWNLSIDMVAASEANVTFSLDPSANSLDDQVLTGLLGDLRQISNARTLGPGAALSFVGTNIWGSLHELGTIFKRFEERNIHMVSQAADDLNLTFIIDQEGADDLLAELHERLFPPELDDPAFGPTTGEVIP